jgi:hypothetical protein
MEKYTIIVDKPHNYWYNLSPFIKTPSEDSQETSDSQR